MPTLTSLSLITAGALTATLTAGPAPTAAAAVAQPAAAPASQVVGSGDERRRIVRYVVRRGDTAIGLAVRFHAWTDELLALNGLTRSSRLQIGQRLRIPVVPPRLRDRKPARTQPGRAQPDRTRPARKPARATPDRAERTQRRSKSDARTSRRQPVTHAYPDRARVAEVIARTARQHGVDPQLALAVSWQEAGWQMHHVSWAGAIGAMQVLPTTGAWMSLYAGRRLRLKRLGDNALAGVLLLSVLDDHTRSTRRMVGAYYQGLGAVRRHGLYSETRRYVANVLAIQSRLEQGRSPG